MILSDSDNNKNFKYIRIHKQNTGSTNLKTQKRRTCSPSSWISTFNKRRCKTAIPCGDQEIPNLNLKIKMKYRLIKNISVYGLA